MNDLDQDVSEDLAVRIEESEALLREVVGATPEAAFGFVPREALHAPFHAPDVPAAVVEADDAVQVEAPLRAASQVTTPGFVRTTPRSSTYRSSWD